MIGAKWAPYGCDAWEATARAGVGGGRAGRVRALPALRAGLIGTLVSGPIGMLVNDSRAAVPSMALALAVPLLPATGIGALPPRPRRASLPGVGEQPAGVAK